MYSQRLNKHLKTQGKIDFVRCTGGATAYPLNQHESIKPGSILVLNALTSCSKRLDYIGLCKLLPHS